MTAPTTIEKINIHLLYNMFARAMYWELLLTLSFSPQIDWLKNSPNNLTVYMYKNIYWLWLRHFWKYKSLIFFTTHTRYPWRHTHHSGLSHTLVGLLLSECDTVTWWVPTRSTNTHTHTQSSDSGNFSRRLHIFYVWMLKPYFYLVAYTHTKKYMDLITLFLCCFPKKKRSMWGFLTRIHKRCFEKPKTK